ASSPAAAGRTLLAADGEDLSTPQLAREIGNALGAPARLLSMPVTLLKLAGAMTGMRAEIGRLVDSLAVDAAETRERLGWRAAHAFGAAELWLPLGLALLLAIVSFADDVKGLPVAARLAAHLAAAGVLVWYLLSPIYIWQAVLLVLGIAWLTNLYNFMDGSDGLAAGMTVIGFAAYAVAAMLAND